MANILPIEKQVMAIHALAEGNPIRSIERMTNIHRDTIMRLGVNRVQWAVYGLPLLPNNIQAFSHPCNFLSAR